MNGARHVLITGASRGIGAHLVRHYLAQDHVVIGCARGAAPVMHKRYTHMCADVADDQAVQTVVGDIRKRFGALDVLINNAGIACMNPMALTPFETARQIMGDEFPRHLRVHPRVAAAAALVAGGADRQSHHRGGAVATSRARRSMPPRRARSRPSRASSLAKRRRSASPAMPSGRVPMHSQLTDSIPTDRIDRLIARQAIPRWADPCDVANVIDFFSGRRARWSPARSHATGRHRMIEFLIEKMEASRDDLAIAMPGRTITYGDLVERVHEWRLRLAALGSGWIISIEGDYGPESIAVFLAATWSGHISVPLSPDSRAHHDSFLDLGQIEFRVVIGDGGSELRTRTEGRTRALHVAARRRASGLVLFSSGSTGKPKAAVHNLQRLLGKYRVPRQRLRTLVFLLLDHIGGVNTLFYTLSNAGAVVLSRIDRRRRSAMRSRRTASSCCRRRRRF